MNTVIARRGLYLQAPQSKRDFGGEAASDNRVTNRPVSGVNLQPLMATNQFRILGGFGGFFLSQTTAGEGGGQNWIRTSEGVSQRIYSAMVA